MLVTQLKTSRVRGMILAGITSAALLLGACGSTAPADTGSAPGASDTAPSTGDTTTDAMPTTTAGDTTTEAMPTTTAGDTAATAPIPGDTTQAAGEVTIAELVANPSAYAGQTVTVMSTPRELVGDRAFRLNDSATAMASAADNLLVIDAMSGNVSDTMLDQPIKVTGVVTTLDVPTLEQQLGVDLDDSLFSDYANRPVLVATSVEIV
jgi:hypothetical protein